MNKMLSICMALSLMALSSGNSNAQNQSNTRVAVIPLWSEGSTWKGTWTDATLYKRSDVVEYDGSSYIAILNHTSTLANFPPNDQWELVAASGASGTIGAKGDTGDEGPKGDTGEVGPKGDIGPQGDVGPQGAKGDKGDIGLTGPQGLTGALGPQGLIGAVGPQGLPGVDGATGPQGLPGTNGVDGATGAVGATGPQGPIGPQGLTGADGMSIFGDGTAGALVVSTVTNWNTNYQANTNFTTCDIQAGQTLTVPSGTIIRCSGDFNNQGTIDVLPWVEGADGADVGSESGQSVSAAGTGNNIGLAFSAVRLRGLLLPGFEGGANGDDGNGSDNTGGAGGGSLVIRVDGTVINNGTISLNGGDAITNIPTSDQSGGGGGAGGIMILVSTGNITNTGTIEANGGNGSNPGTGDDDHAGGGGGGGLVHLISPNANAVAGTFNLQGGAAGVQPANSLGSTGGAGGAMGGNGGSGGVDLSSVITLPTAGDNGVVLRTQESSPQSLFNL